MRVSLALGVVVLIGTVVVARGASAQLLGPTPTTSPPQQPTPTSAPKSTTTTAPKLVGGGGDDPGSTSGTIPPGYQKIINSVKRSKANNTTSLLLALQPLVTEGGMQPTDAAILGFGRFPVAGLAKFTDDWLNPRFTPVFHLHEGTDIFAAMGTPVRAPVDGVVRHSSGGAGGTAAYIRTPEGHEVYMAHLSGYSDVKPGQTVKVGDIIGFVGNTGNAAGGAAHLHFEIHPKGKGPVNPKPYLDQWIAQALQAAPTLIQNYLGRAPQQPVVPQVLSERLSTEAITLAAPPRAQLAWASSANPTGGALRLAEVEAAVAAGKVDWVKRAQVAEFQRQQAAAADQIAKAIDRPLTPLLLRDVLGVR